MDNGPFILGIDPALGHDRVSVAIASIERRLFDVLIVPPELMREPQFTLTARRIEDDMRNALPRLADLQVHVSRVLEGMRLPVRVHKRRRGMSAAYHRRVQKKWNKRYGTAPAAVLMKQFDPW